MLVLKDTWGIKLKKPKLEKIEELLKQGKNFSLTRERYISLTGMDIPQSKSYTENKSAVAKRANDYNYRLKVKSEIIEFTKN